MKFRSEKSFIDYYACTLRASLGRILHLYIRVDTVPVCMYIYVYISSHAQRVSTAYLAKITLSFEWIRWSLRWNYLILNDLLPLNHITKSLKWNRVFFCQEDGFENISAKRQPLCPGPSVFKGCYVTSNNAHYHNANGYYTSVTPNYRHFSWSLCTHPV